MIDDANHSIDDPYLRHRLATRSLVGGREKGSLRVAVAPDSLLNVVRGGMPGYRWWGAGFVLSANRFACFPFDDRGTTRWFDLSLHDLPATHGMSDFDLGPRRSTSTTLAFDWEAPTPRATLHGPVSKQIP